MNAPDGRAATLAVPVADEARTRRAMLHILEDLQRERNAIQDAHREWINTVDAVRDPLMVHDGNCKVVRANRAYAERAGMDYAAMIGRPYWECFPRRAGPLPGCSPAEIVAAGGAVAPQEFSLEGGEVFVSRNFLVAKRHGESHHVLHLFEDVTERRHAEEALRASEERSRATFDQAAMGITHTSLGGTLIDVNPAFCSMLGYAKSELAGRNFLELTHADDKGSSGVLRERLSVGDFTPSVMEKRYLRKDGSVMWATVTVALARDGAGKPEYFITMVQDISERKHAESAASQSAGKLSVLLRQTIETVALAVEKRDPYTAGHQRRVADLAVAIGQELGMTGERLEGLRLGATIHDIGKIYVPAEILARPGKISAAEFEIIKAHAQIGYDIMKGVDFPWPVAQMILQHHERLDGSGYPNGAKGGDIILESRILAVADVVEAMASHRPYRPGLGIEAALKEIAAKRGNWFDPAAVDACLRLFRDKGFKLDGAA